MSIVASLFVILILVIDNGAFLFESLPTSDKLPEDASRNITELAIKNGMPIEEHEIITPDGYVLKTFRIPGDKTRPVLLAHGIFGTSGIFLSRGENSFCALLLKEGYDIWLLNFRGTSPSRRHISLNPNTDKRFWDFSVHEYGNQDLASNIDYILSATNQSKLSIVGISQGTTTTFILTASKPEYNNKIKVFIALAPIVFLENLTPPSSILLQFSIEINEILKAVGMEEIVGHQSFMKKMYDLICSQSFGYNLCVKIALFTFLGADEDQLEPEFYKTSFGYFPDTTSRKNLAHYAQIGRNKRFAQYDYGPIQNLATYKSLSPPTYDLNNVIINTYLVCGKNDKLSTLKDIETLRGKLPNVKGFRVMPSDNFNHLDYVWGKDAHKVTIPIILKVLKKYNI